MECPCAAHHGCAAHGELPREFLSPRRTVSNKTDGRCAPIPPFYAVVGVIP